MAFKLFNIYEVLCNWSIGRCHSLTSVGKIRIDLSRNKFYRNGSAPKLSTPVFCYMKSLSIYLPNYLYAHHLFLRDFRGDLLNIIVDHGCYLCSGYTAFGIKTVVCSPNNDACLVHGFYSYPVAITCKILMGIRYCLIVYREEYIQLLKQFMIDFKY